MHITKWLAAAPQDYGFITSDSKHVDKTKGFRSDSEFEAIRTFENRAKLHRGLCEKLPLVQTQFVRTEPFDAEPHSILVGDAENEWDPEFKNCVVIVINEFFYDSLPYGY